MSRSTALPDDGIVDQVLVARVVERMHYEPLTVAERRLAAQLLHRKGEGMRSIAALLRCNVAAVAEAIKADQEASA